MEQKEIIPFKTYEEQLNVIRSKNITLDEDSNLKYIDKLKNHSYYSLINGYKPYFLADGQTDKMVDGTKFDYFLDFKLLEIDLGDMLLKYLLIVEQGFRTRLAYIIAREFGTDDTKYIKPDNYSSQRRYSRLYLYQVLPKLEAVISSPNVRSYSYYFARQRTPQASIPPWILLQDIDFFTVIQLYTCLPENLKQELRSDYIQCNSRNSSEATHFADTMNFLREYRNIFAHSKRHFQERIANGAKRQICLTSQFPNLFENTNFDNGDNKDIQTCINLTFAFLNDTQLQDRMLSVLMFFLIRDNYMNKDAQPTTLFAGKTVYDLLNLTEDFLIKLTNAIKSKRDS